MYFFFVLSRPYDMKTFNWASSQLRMIYSLKKFSTLMGSRTRNRFTFICILNFENGKIVPN